MTRTFKIFKFESIADLCYKTGSYSCYSRNLDIVLCLSNYKMGQMGQKFRVCVS